MAAVCSPLPATEAYPTGGVDEGFAGGNRTGGGADEGVGAGPGFDWDLIRGGFVLAVGRMDFPGALGVCGHAPLVLLVELLLPVDSFLGEG